jgi:hypothetical protein
MLLVQEASSYLRVHLEDKLDRLSRNLLVYEAFSYQCMRPEAPSARGLKLLKGAPGG